MSRRWTACPWAWSSWPRPSLCWGLLLSKALSLLDLANERLDAPGHHHTLRVALAHAWGLLDDEEQRALASLAVFSGSFELDAAAQVCGASTPDTARRLQRLARHSWVQATGGRFRVLQAVRAFAAEQCADAHDAAWVRLTAFACRLEKVSESLGPRVIRPYRADLYAALARATPAQALDIGSALLDVVVASADLGQLASMLDEHLGRAPPTLQPALRGLWATAARWRWPRDPVDRDRVLALLRADIAAGVAGPSTYLMLVWHQVLSGEPTQELAREAVLACPEPPLREGGRALGPLLLKVDEPSMAIAHLHRLIARQAADGRDAVAEETRGMVAFELLRSGQLLDAVHVLQALREREVGAWATSAIAYLRLGRVDEALSAAAEVARSHSETFVHLGRCIIEAIRLRRGEPPDPSRPIDSGKLPDAHRALALALSALRDGRRPERLGCEALDQLWRAWREGEPLEPAASHMMTSSILVYVLEGRDVA